MCGGLKGVVLVYHKCYIQLTPRDVRLRMYQYKIRGNRGGRVGRWMLSAISATHRDRGVVVGRAERRVAEMEKRHPEAEWEYEIEGH